MHGYLQHWAAIHVDFTANKPRPGKDLLAKACNLKQGKALTIIDATAGLGKDAYALALLGAKVIMIEENPILCEMLASALTQTSKALTLLKGNAEKILASICAEQVIDVIYLDPMFPERKKSALVKKEMQLLQRLIHETDNENLANIARQQKVKRVVIKRPRHAKPLIKNPHYQYSGKTCRFDVY